MISNLKTITINKIKKPSKADINQQIQWLSNSLGLFSLRDKDKSCFRLFIELLKCAKKGEFISSDELAYKLNLSRGTVIHHLSKLMESSIVFSNKNKYSLRTKNLATLVNELKDELNEVFEDLLKAAENIDKTLNLEK